MFAITFLISPLVGNAVYAFKQKSWAYMNVWLTLWVALMTIGFSSPDGEIDKSAKVALKLAAGGAAALVARNNKKSARKELGLDD